MSAIEDLRLIIATVQILFQKESTQGVENSEILAMQELSVECEEKQVG